MPMMDIDLPDVHCDRVSIHSGGGIKKEFKLQTYVYHLFMIQMVHLNLHIYVDIF